MSNNQTNKFISTLKDFNELFKSLKEIVLTVVDITKESKDTLMKFTAEEAAVATTEVKEFREALRETNAAGDAILLRYEQVKNDFQAFCRFTLKLMQNKLVSSEENKRRNQLISSVQLRAVNCFESYQSYKEKLKRAIDVATCLVEKCKIGHQDAQDSAATLRIVGYGSSGLMIAAGGFLAVTTGGIGIPIAAVVGTGTGLVARNRAKRLDELANNFKVVQSRVEADITRLNQVADKVEANQEMTRLVVEELQIQLRLAEQEINTESMSN